jgi:hypothetical protein
MRRPFYILMVMLAVGMAGKAGFSAPSPSLQQDRLEGRWEGTVQSPAGDSKAAAIFKKNGDSYTGTMSRLRGDGDFPLGPVKLDGDKVTASAHFDIPQGALDLKLDLTLSGDTLKGKGEASIGGQTFELTYDLKRAAQGAAAQSASGQSARPSQGEGQAQPQRRPVVPQPQQQQSLDYFIGRWSYRWMGRESPLGPGGPFEATATFAAIPDSKFIEGRIESKSDGASTPLTIGFDEDTKMLVFDERWPNGVDVLSMGDWRSPVAIRFQVAPIKIKNQVLRLKRTISVISAFSFSLTEELSVDGGPFERLGQGMFTKAPTAAAAPQK